VRESSLQGARIPVQQPAARRGLPAERLHRRILADAPDDGRTVADLVGIPRRMSKLGLGLDTPAPEGVERKPPRL
jgi:hypothetical protein